MKLKLKHGFWISLAATLVIMLVMNFIGAPLVTAAAPFGIVSFELAWNASRAAEILASWDATARLYAAFSLGLDYLFMAVYSLALALGTLLAADSLAARRWPPGGRARWLAVLFAASAIFDAGENAFLFWQLVAGPADAAAWAAALLAVIKFGLIFLGLVFGFYGLTVSLLVRRPAKNH